jgi:hypothetical protein
VTALDTINRLDDGLPVSAADLTLLEIAEQDASNRWYRIDRQVESWQADVCVVCGGPDGPECAGCTASWDKTVDRAGDL